MAPPSTTAQRTLPAQALVVKSWDAATWAKGQADDAAEDADADADEQQAEGCLLHARCRPSPTVTQKKQQR
ncbi:hypothetical protein ABZ897_59340 [Nonomuraea sp. NPDC046802]|uniref:hypothetical protein n=1 Tax=Nonomuraea sp. NPDC046802 TaxID=3154919 RepID=UPI003407DD88